jgi:hypothetical protein
MSISIRLGGISDMLIRFARAALAGSLLLGCAVTSGQAATPKDVFVMASDLSVVR